jgi:single-strand selective monofunctional uracil DNA glycosylase
MTVDVAVLEAARALSAALARGRFGPPVAAVYDPFDYAWEPFADYVRRYVAPDRTLLLGMNPGPWGMAQTGVPFGEITAARDFLRIEGRIVALPTAHPARPVLGWACTRSEVSGARFWGWARARYQTPEAFFARYVVLPWCPLMFLDGAGRNLTPDRLAAADRVPLEAACDANLSRWIAALRPVACVGIGRLAADRLRRVGASRIIAAPHPSPASPAANRGWQAAWEAALAAGGLPVADGAG